MSVQSHEWGSVCVCVWLETDLFGHDNVQIVFSLIDVRAHRNDAAHARRVRLRWSHRRSMHNRDLRIPQKVRRASETVQHPASGNVGRVRVCVDIDLNGGVHANDPQSADDLRVIGDGLRTQDELVVVAIPVLVEALEAIRGKADRSCSGEVQVAGIEKVEEGVLEDFGPHG